MTPAQQGFLLLTSSLGDPDRRPLTAAQFRTLAHRVSQMERPRQERNLALEDLTALGYGAEMSQRILKLLEDRMTLSRYLSRGAAQDCIPMVRVSEEYPGAVRKKLGLDAPGCLWAKGNRKILQKPAVGLVGSRALLPENRKFARQVGRQAALQGWVLVSGNARGADRAAQDA